MPYMMSDPCPYLAVKDRAGILVGHYNPAPEATEPGARVSGPYIEEIPDAKQRANFLRNNLVVEVDGPPAAQPRSLPAPTPPAPSKRYMLTGRCDAVWVTDADGIQHMHIADPVIAASSHGALGPLIEWIGAAQCQAYLYQGWIVEVDTAGRPVEAAVAPEVVTGEWTDQVRDSSGRSLSEIMGARAAETPELAPVAPVAGGLVEECLADLARLDVALDSGAPTCRKALRYNGISYGNEVIALAVRRRKVLATLSAGAAT
jgi:cytochrome c oxidase cbb3-type subunit 2